ncbi:MAG: hypothetical protein ACR2RA_04095 [Geminicoccaceae bacterium]
MTVGRFGGYLDLVKHRFDNPQIENTIPRLCQDGSNRRPTFILPSVQPVNGMALGDVFGDLADSPDFRKTFEIMLTNPGRMASPRRWRPMSIAAEIDRRRHGQHGPASSTVMPP